MARPGGPTPGSSTPGVSATPGPKRHTVKTVSHPGPKKKHPKRSQKCRNYGILRTVQKLASPLSTPPCSRLICASLHLHRHCPRFIVLIDAGSEQDQAVRASQTAKVRPSRSQRRWRESKRSQSNPSPSFQTVCRQRRCSVRGTS